MRLLRAGQRSVRRLNCGVRRHMMGTFGFNALQIILASGFSGVTPLGHIPSSVVALVALPEPVSLVQANESVTFKLSAKAKDPVRRDTAIYRWLVEVAKVVVQRLSIVCQRREAQLLSYSVESRHRLAIPR
jgi:hypothetical protein